MADEENEDKTVTEDDGLTEAERALMARDEGRKALAAERKARKEAESAREEAAAELERLRSQLAKAASGKKADAADADDVRAATEQARRDAEAAVLKKANDRVLAARAEALAAGKLADPADVARYLDLSEFEVGDDFSTDDEAISDAISDLIKRKPYLAAKANGFQGTGDGGAAGREGRPSQLTGADLKTMSTAQIVKAREEGRLERYLNGG